jgi:hypothetical protein
LIEVSSTAENQPEPVPKPAEHEDVEENELEEEEDLPKEEEDQQENEEEKPKPKTTRRGQNTPIEPPVGGYGGGPSDLSLLPEYGKHIGSLFVDRRSKFDLIKNFRL